MSKERKNLLAVAILLVVLATATLVMSLLLPSPAPSESDQENEQLTLGDSEEAENTAEKAEEMADLLEQDSSEAENQTGRVQVAQIAMPMMQNGQPTGEENVNISVELPGEWILDTEYSPGTMFHYADGTVAVEGFYASAYNENATLWTNARAWTRSNYLSSDVITIGGVDAMLSIYALSDDATESSPYAYVYAVPHRDIIYFVEFRAAGDDNEQAKAEQMEILQSIVFLAN